MMLIARMLNLEAPILLLSCLPRFIHSLHWTLNNRQCSGGAEHAEPLAQKLLWRGSEERSTQDTLSALLSDTAAHSGCASLSAWHVCSQDNLTTSAVPRLTLNSVSVTFPWRGKQAYCRLHEWRWQFTYFPQVSTRTNDQETEFNSVPTSK